jgi:hypothetical protein
MDNYTVIQSAKTLREEFSTGWKSLLFVAMALGFYQPLANPQRTDSRNFSLWPASVSSPVSLPGCQINKRRHAGKIAPKGRWMEVILEEHLPTPSRLGHEVVAVSRNV